MAVTDASLCLGPENDDTGSTGRVLPGMNVKVPSPINGTSDYLGKRSTTFMVIL